MIRTYDLLLQPPAGDAVHDHEKVIAAFVAKGAKPGEAGRVTLPVGKLDVDVGPVRENGKAVATEVRLPLGRDTTFIATLLPDLMEIGRALKLRLVDPSTNNELLETSGAAIEESYRRTAEYAGEFLGVGDALGRVEAPVPDALTRTGTFWLAIGVFLLAAWLGWSLSPR